MLTLKVVRPEKLSQHYTQSRLLANSSWKSDQLNEAKESAEGHQTLFFLVRGWGLGTRLGETLHVVSVM